MRSSCTWDSLITKKIFQLNPRNEMLIVNKLLQMLISRNLSVLSSKGSRPRLRTKAGHHIRLRVKADHLFRQSLYQISAKPHLPLWFRSVKYCPQHTLSQTVQTQSQLSYLDVPGKPFCSILNYFAQPSSRIMTCVEHLKIDLNLNFILLLMLLLWLSVDFASTGST